MRKVVSESEVAHLWANQVQDEARKSNGSMFFEGRKIYSYGYHFPIAVIDKDNSNTVFFTTAKYGSTTAKHIQTVRGASRHKNIIYCVAPTLAESGYHADNINNFEYRAKKVSLKLAKSRKPFIYLSEIAVIREEFIRYAEYCKVDLSKYSLFFIYIKSKDGGVVASELENINNEIERVKQQKKHDKAQKILVKNQKKELVKWRIGEIYKFYSYYNLDNYTDYLRYNKDLDIIQTSQEVDIPIKTAKTLYKEILKIVKNGECHLCGTKFMNMYEIKEVNKDYIIVGCHKITIVEIENLAKQLNW